MYLQLKKKMYNNNPKAILEIDFFPCRINVVKYLNSGYLYPQIQFINFKFINI